MTDKLKTCPFCNGSANIIDGEMERNANAEVIISFDVICDDCGAMTGYEYGRTRENATKVWNKRVGD